MQGVDGYVGPLYVYTMIQEPIKDDAHGVVIEVVADLVSMTVDLNVSANYSMEPGGFAELTAEQARALAQQLTIAADYLED